ncbi:MAG TPA: hypothetical protein VF665_19680 [Longimicrobium sp.]|jgi:hypothetical protein|uniref:hypothetical protein n=1 Tax=Longimicrobium sp. TaxID=2029185 RepID=UPI002ED81281
MTDAERELLRNLTAGALPLWLQIAAGAGLVVLFRLWPRLYYGVLDSPLRTAVGRMIGADVVWVPRNSAAYPTPAQWEPEWTLWTWGIADPAARTFARDVAAWLLSILLVNGVAGLWPGAVLYALFVPLRALSYVVFFPACIAFLFFYAAFWSGRREIAGMHRRAAPAR